MSEFLKTIDKLNDDRDRIIKEDSIDPLDYKADEYRKQHSWPNLVAKKLNKPYKVGTTKSASNLKQILNSIKPPILKFHEISKDVNNPVNNDPALIKPIN